MSANQPSLKHFSAHQVIEDIKAGNNITITQPALIDGDFVLSAVEVTGIIQIEHAEFTGRVDLSHSTFNNVISFKRSTFAAENEIVAFNSATFKKDVYLEDAIFAGEVDFSHSKVEGVLHSNSVTFNKAVSFSGTHFYKSVYFDRCQFEGIANFHGATEIDGDAIFTRAEFHQDVDFYNAQIHGIVYCLFANFHEGANFSAVQIGGDAEFLNVQFEGIASFNDAQIGGNASFWASDFTDVTDFAGAIVDGFGEFLGTQFLGRTVFAYAHFAQYLACTSRQNDSVTTLLARLRSVNLRDDEVEQIISRSMRKVVFSNEVNFSATRVGGNAYFTDVTFESFESQSLLSEEQVTFNGVQIGGSALFLQTVFKCKISFVGLEVGSQANFSHCEFQYVDGSDWHVSFNGMRASHAILFIGTRFSGRTEFTGMQTEILADFSSAIFDYLHHSDWNVNFNGMKIVGSANFIQTVFRGNVEFLHAKIGQYVDFTGAKFQSADNGESIVEFNGFQVTGACFFRDIISNSEVKFISTSIGGNADFSRTIFEKEATFYNLYIGSNLYCFEAYFKSETKFANIHVAGDSQLNGSKFEQEVTFTDSNFSKDIYLSSAHFANNLAWSNVSCSGTLRFDDNTTLKQKIDLRGSTYKRIEPAHLWQTLLDVQQPYDRQPFVHLEEVFRRAGRDKLASQVYFLGRRRHTREMRRQKARRAWVIDFLYWQISGYGEQLWRLAVLILLMLVIGMLAFHIDGTVVLPADPPADNQVVNLGWIDSGLFSLKQILPIAIPAGENWQPSDETVFLGVRSEIVATILKVLGWILVPIGVTDIARALRR